MTSYHLIATPGNLSKLKADLGTAMPNSHELASLQSLEQLPHLNAVMNGGFRMSYGVIQRLRRISLEEDLHFRERTIPAGTPVGMTSIFMHENPDKFPNPREFPPERWLDSGDRLEKYLVDFSQGTRQCLGLNLVRAEIYLTLAAIFRRFDSKFFETTRADIDVYHHFFKTEAKQRMKGVGVMSR